MKLAYKTECPECFKENTAHFENRILKQAELKCQFCGKKTTLSAHHWHRSKDRDGKEWTMADKNKTAHEMYAEDSASIFNIDMRLDKYSPHKSQVNSVVVDAARGVDALFEKVMSCKVCDEKGGRKNGGGVMGQSAATCSGRPGFLIDWRQGEEWLHLWGDNLGGPSEVRNFVAGSAASNTEMLVIERALAEGLPNTLNLKFKVTALCSRLNVAEYIRYEVITPKGQNSSSFSHLIDANNRYFSRVDLETVKGLIEGWLKRVHIA